MFVVVWFVVYALFVVCGALCVACCLLFVVRTWLCGCVMRVVCCVFVCFYLCMFDVRCVMFWCLVIVRRCLVFVGWCLVVVVCVFVVSVCVVRCVLFCIVFFVVDCCLLIVARLFFIRC